MRRCCFSNSARCGFLRKHLRRLRSLGGTPNENKVMVARDFRVFALVPRLLKLPSERLPLRSVWCAERPLRGNASGGFGAGCVLRIRQSPASFARSTSPPDRRQSCNWEEAAFFPVSFIASPRICCPSTLRVRVEVVTRRRRRRQHCDRAAVHRG